MSSYKRQLSKDLASHFSDLELVIKETSNGVICTVPVESWLEVAKTLRDDRDFDFDLCIDVCGVDYLSYGETEWPTDDVTHTGFSRGIRGKGPGRFSWSERR